jgi:phage tail sheath gpL-like
MPLDTGIPQYHAGFQRFCVSGVNAVAEKCKGLLWGQMLNPQSPPNNKTFADVNKAATPGKLVQVLSPAHAIQLFGAGSQLAQACHLYFCQCGGYLGNGSLYAVPLLDESGSTKPVYTITLAGDPEIAGQLDFEIPCHVTSLSGGLYSVPVSSADTLAEIATALVAEINADPASMFVAAVGQGVVTLTGKHGGTILNNAKVLFNSQFGQSFPKGLRATFTQTVVGGGDPDLSVALGNLPSCCYDCWGLLYEDPIAIELLVREIAERWACARDQCFGHLFHSRTEEDAAALVEYGNAFNDAERNIIPVLNTYKYPGWMLAAAWTGRVCCGACENPGRPVVRDNGCLDCMTDADPCNTSIFSPYEQEQMVQAGLSLWGYNRSGKIQIVNNVTNWKYNFSGDRDITWTNTESRYIVPAIVGVMRRFNNTYYSSSALVENGVPIPAGSTATSPALYKAHLVGYLEGREDEDESSAGILGFLLNDISLENDITVANNTTGQPDGYGDCHRLDVQFTARLIRQLLRIATSIKVRPC